MFLRFIKKTKSCLNSNKLKILVLGNESSDLDSVVSSLVYSYFKQEKHLDEFDVIPVCCIPKNNIKLKKDVTMWLTSFGIDPEKELVFLDDVRDLISAAQGGSSIRLCLLDHHKPQITMMTELVREVIDHRKVVYMYPEGQLEVNHIELVGSCCTLIAKFIIENQMIEDRVTLLRMLHGVILLDTDCLTSNNNRTTKEDIDVVTIIESIVGAPLDSRQTIYERLFLAKSDVSGLGLNMMIQRDLKILEFVWKNSKLKMAIPTLFSIDVENLMGIEDLENQLTETLKDLESDMIIGLTCGTSTHERRGYMLFSKDIELTNKVYEYLLLPEHGLDMLSVDFRSNIKIFYHNQLHITRKMFIPVIEKFFAVESKKQQSEQINNCSSDICCDINLVIKTIDPDACMDIDDVVENEGAPYTLSTPLRSYSGSPDNRNSDRTLPSLNNRYTLQLVDQKRQKHHVEMDVDSDIFDENQDLDRINNDDVSPLAFTPENSDDEWILDKVDNSKKDLLSSSSPYHRHFSMTDEMKNKKDSLSDQIMEELILRSENVSTDLSNTQSAFDTYSNKFSNFSNQDDSEFTTLEEKVDKKRQKLHSNHIESIAASLVRDVMRESENIIVEELNVEAMLSEWSECYADEEKKQIINSLNTDDMAKLAELLTTSLIKDCLKVHEFASLEMDGDANNSAAENNFADTKPHSSTGASMDNDDDDDNSLSSLEITLPAIEINDDCHLGNMINDENQNIFAACVNTSSADVVENSSFNLYRRISSNQVDFSEDEKELLMTAGDWLPKEEIIYSDSELEEHNINHQYSSIDHESNEVPKIIIVPENEAYMDTSNLDNCPSTEISLNYLDQMLTPDLNIIEQLENTDCAESFSESSSNKSPNVGTGEFEQENSNVVDTDLDASRKCFEQYEVAFHDAGHYIDASNNNERTRLISLSSCDFPDKADQNYHLIMQYIFECTSNYLESVDDEFYTIVYFHCFGNQQRAPSIFWLHQCYQTITYRLKKNLKHLYIVHPTIWVRAALFFSRFFINSKFYSKIQYVSELEKLGTYIPTSGIRFPPDVLKE